MSRRGGTRHSDKREAGGFRASFGVLLFLFAAIAQIAMTPVFAAAHADAGSIDCVVTATIASGDAGAATTDRSQRKAMGGHCDRCTMATSPTLPSKVAARPHRVTVAIVVSSPPQWIEPVEPRRPGDKRSRAPPVFS